MSNEEVKVKRLTNDLEAAAVRINSIISEFRKVYKEPPLGPPTNQDPNDSVERLSLLTELRSLLVDPKIDANSVLTFVTDRWETERFTELNTEQLKGLIRAINIGRFNSSQPPIDQPPNDLPEIKEVGFPDQYFAEPSDQSATLTVANENLTSASFTGHNVVRVIKGVKEPDVSTRVWFSPGYQHASTHLLFDGGAWVSKLLADGNRGSVEELHFWDAECLNEDSKFWGGCASNTPADIGPNESFLNSLRATPHAGLFAFHKCHFGAQPNNTGWLGYGGKMWLHMQAPHDLLLDRCILDEVREHEVYQEHVRKLHVRNCLFKGNGGNGLQVVTRMGHMKTNDYTHGNRLNTPVGWDGGFVVVEDSVFEDYQHGFRDSSQITIVNNLGPTIVKNVTMRNCLSAFAGWTDDFKGVVLFKPGENGAPTEYMIYRREVEGKTDIDLTGWFASGPAYFDELDVYWDDINGKRPMVMARGFQELHFGRFEIRGKQWAIVLDHESPSVVNNGPTRFYDKDSVDKHLGRIGYYDADRDRVVAFTEEQLQDMTVESGR